MEEKKEFKIKFYTEDEIKKIIKDKNEHLYYVDTGIDEVIEFKHTAYSKSVFAKGAVEAAKFLKDKPAGMYDMADVIG